MVKFVIKRCHVLFPAYAGVIPGWNKVWSCNVAFPRIRGGDPYEDKHRERGKNFSPHTRG